MAIKSKNIKEKKESALAQLKYPLVFFGLALTVIEGTLGITLATNSFSENVTLLIISWMSIIFLSSIIIVAYLVYKVPSHIMLTAQKQTEQTEQSEKQLKIIRNRIEKNVEIIRTLSGDSTEGIKDVKISLEELDLILKNVL